MEKDIDRIQKNADTEIVVRVDDFGGKRGVTIREFVKSERYTGFTKAGTRIPVEKFAQFKAAINSINEAELAEAVSSQEKLPSGENEVKGEKKSVEKSKKEELDIDEEAAI